MSQNPLTPDQVVGILQDAKQAHQAVLAASATAAISAFMALAVPMVRPPMWQGATLFCAASALWHSQVLRGANQRFVLADARKRALEGASQESLIYRVVEGVSPIQDPVQVVPQLSADPVAAAIQRKWEAMKLYAQPLEPIRGFTFTRYQFVPNSELSADRFLKTGNDIKQVLGLKDEPLLGVEGGAVAVDVPNAQRQFCNFREYVEFENRAYTDPLEVAVGLTLTGQLINLNLSDPDSPHILGGGKTGSGKSELVRAMLLSALYRFPPTALRIAIIDFKGVDFEDFKQSPHLGHAIVNKADRVLDVLRSLLKELLSRVEAFQGIASNILKYNALVDNPLVRWIILIDEYAQMIAAVRAEFGEDGVKELDSLLNQIAQLGRAFGIHLWVFTQKPLMRKPATPCGIDSTLKENLAARIALRVGDHHASQVIMDDSGAEKLLGKGDLLFNGQRLQSLCVSDSGAIKAAIARYASHATSPKSSVNDRVRLEKLYEQEVSDDCEEYPLFSEQQSKQAQSNDFLSSANECEECESDELTDRELTDLMKIYAKLPPNEMPLGILKLAIAYFENRLGIKGQIAFIENYWGIKRGGGYALYEQAKTRYIEARNS